MKVPFAKPNAEDGRKKKIYYVHKRKGNFFKWLKKTCRLGSSKECKKKNWFCSIHLDMSFLIHVNPPDLVVPQLFWKHSCLD